MNKAPNSPMPATTPSAGQCIGCLLLLLIGLQLAIGPVVQLSTWRVPIEPRAAGEPAHSDNTNVQEALAWRHGRLDLPRRVHDSALYQGRVYSVNPPLFSLMSFAAITVSGWTGGPADAFPALWYVALVALPIPLLGYWALVRACHHAGWAALLAFSWMAGSAVLPCLMAGRDAGICQVNHLLSQTGLMLIAGTLAGWWHLRTHDVPGRAADVPSQAADVPSRAVDGPGDSLVMPAAECRAVAPATVPALWPACVGLVIVGLSRPPMLAYALPVAWLVWTAGRARRASRTAAVAVAVVIPLAIMMTLNALKFGSPWESGYRYVYEGRSDAMAVRGREALFSISYVPGNAWWMNLSLPGWDIGPGGLRPLADPYGASVWFTTPILLLTLWTARQWWRVPLQRALVLASLLTIGVFLCYHNNGYIQVGHFRYALDFMPAWLVVCAAHLCTPRRRWFALAATAWSALYFHLLAGVL